MGSVEIVISAKLKKNAVSQLSSDKKVKPNKRSEFLDYEYDLKLPPMVIHKQKESGRKEAVEVQKDWFNIVDFKNNSNELSKMLKP